MGGGPLEVLKGRRSSDVVEWRDISYTEERARDDDDGEEHGLDAGGRSPRALCLGSGLIPRATGRRGALQTGSKKTIDPCMVATADQLKPSLANVAKGYFLFKYSQGGEFVTLTGRNLTDAACPNLRVSVLAQVTTGVPAGAQGTACLSDIDLTALNLPDAPVWLNNSWFKARLIEKRIRPFFNMAAPMDAFLQRGGRLQGMEGD